MKTIFAGILGFVLLSGLSLRAQSPFYLPDFAPKTDISMEDAVKLFNQRAQENGVGKTQPPLTVEELNAAIRGDVVDDAVRASEVFQRFQKIAQTGIFPKGCYLIFSSGFPGYNGFDYKVWWIDLMMAPGPSQSPFTCRIRMQMISSEPRKN